MNKILSFLILSVFFFVGFAHSSMLVFSMGENMTMGENNTNSPFSEDNNKCSDVCCGEGSIEHGIGFNTSSFQKKISKLSCDPISPNTYFIKVYSFGEKNLVKKYFPPYYARNISNYSYHTLVRIIKSNT